VRGWEIVPRTPIRHGFGGPLEAVGRTACRPGRIDLSSLDRIAQSAKLPTGELARLPLRVADRGATHKGRDILFAEYTSRVMPEEPRPNVWG
jgi:hypothetical protein